MLTLSNEISQDFSERGNDCEQLLIEICQEGRTEIHVGERAFFAREMGWDVAEIKRQLRRVRNILRLQAIAGTPQDRTAALDECQVANDLFAKESPKIISKIEELQTKLANLERDAKLSSTRVEQQADAVEELRQHVPDSVKEPVQREILILKQTLGRDLQTLQSRKNELRSILNIDHCHKTLVNHLEHTLAIALPAAVIRDDSRQYIRYRFSPAWEGLKLQCEQEYAEILQRIPEMQAEYDGSIENVNCGLDVLSNGIQENA